LIATGATCPTFRRYITHSGHRRARQVANGSRIVCRGRDAYFFDGLDCWRRPNRLKSHQGPRVASTRKSKRWRAAGAFKSSRSERSGVLEGNGQLLPPRTEPIGSARHLVGHLPGSWRSSDQDIRWLDGYFPIEIAAWNGAIRSTVRWRSLGVQPECKGDAMVVYRKKNHHCVIQ